MKKIAFDWSAGLTDITVALRSSPTATATTALAAETATGSGVYVASFADDVAGDQAVQLKRGSRVIAGNLVATMPAVGATAWIGERTPPARPTVYPIAATRNDGPVPPTCLTVYRKAATTLQLIITNADGTAPDLSGRDLEFVVSTARDEVVIRVADVAIEGDDNNIAVVELTGEDNNLAVGEYRHGLWEGAYPSGKPWAQGDYIVEAIGGPYVAP